MTVTKVPEKKGWPAGKLTEADAPFMFAKTGDTGAPTRLSLETRAHTGSQLVTCYPEHSLSKLTEIETPARNTNPPFLWAKHDGGLGFVPGESGCPILRLDTPLHKLFKAPPTSTMTPSRRPEPLTPKP